MKNLFSELQKADAAEIDRQMADFSCATIPGSVWILGRQIQYLLLTVFARFLPAARQKKEQKEWISMELWRNRRKETFGQMSPEQKKQKLCQQIRRKIKVASGKTVRETVAEDVLSVEATKAAAGLFPKYQMRGKSTAEIGDLISRMYPEMKKSESDHQLKLWYGYAVAWLVLLFCAGKLLAWKGMLLLVEAVLGEVVIAWLVSIRLARLQLAHLIWLVGSATGTFNIEENDLPTSRLDAREKNRLALQLQGIHTLNHSKMLAEQEKKKLFDQIQSLEKTIEHNQELIHRQEQITESDPSSAYRVINEKIKENEMLQEQIQNIRHSMTKQETYIHKIEGSIQFLQQEAGRQIAVLWKKEFPQLQESKEFLAQLTLQFGIADLVKIEQRLYELCHTSTPYAIAQSEKGAYQMEFRTQQGDLGKFRFVRLPQEKRMYLLAIERMGTLEEPVATPQQLQNLLITEGIQVQEEPVREQNVPREPEQALAKPKRQKEQQLEKLLEDMQQMEQLEQQIKEREDACQKSGEMLAAVRQKAMEESQQLRKELSGEKDKLLNKRKQYDVLEQQLQMERENTKHIREQQSQLLQELRQQLQSYQTKEQAYQVIIERYEKEKARQEERIRSLRKDIAVLKRQKETLQQQTNG